MPTHREDTAYYRQRIEASVMRAAGAACPCARKAHEELARLYREKLAALERVRSLTQVVGNGVPTIEQQPGHAKVPAPSRVAGN